MKSDPRADAGRGRRAFCAALWPGAALPLMLFVLAALLCVRFLLDFAQPETFHDWDEHLSYAEIAARAVRVYHQLPLWNPIPCGGMPLLAHPQSRVLTPFFLLHLLLPPDVALRWEILFHYWLAAAGLAALVLRHVRSDDLTTDLSAGRAGTTTDRLTQSAAALAGALTFCSTTALALHLAEGHLWILTVAYLPWVVLCYEQGLCDPRRAALGGALLALMIGEGGIYPAPHLVLLLALYAAALALRRRRVGPLLTLGLLLVCALLLSAPKTLPMMAFLQRRPRLVTSTEWTPFSGLAEALLGRRQGLGRSFAFVRQGRWSWTEHGAYVGPVALALALLALWPRRTATARDSRDAFRNRTLAALAVFFAALSCGSFAPWAPWTLLHRLPGLHSMHVPSRFRIEVVFLVALLCGAGVARLLTRCPVRMRPAAAALALLVLGGDVLGVRAGILTGTRCPLRPFPAALPAGQALTTWHFSPAGSVPMCSYSALSASARAGVALLQAYEPLCPRKTPKGREEFYGRQPGLLGVDDPGYPGEAFFAAGQGTVEVVDRTQNTIDLLVRGASAGSLIVLAQNFDAGWSVDHGSLLDSAERLALVPDVSDAGDAAGTLYHLRYFPPHLKLGLAAFCAGLLVLALCHWRFSRRHRAAR